MTTIEGKHIVPDLRIQRKRYFCLSIRGENERPRIGYVILSRPNEWLTATPNVWPFPNSRTNWSCYIVLCVLAGGASLVAPTSSSPASRGTLIVTFLNEW